MRIYSDENDNILEKALCNNCGKALRIKNGMIAEGYAAYKDVFGYFSDKDGQVHEFELCEKCYDKITGQFRIPVQISEATEMI